MWVRIMRVGMSVEPAAALEKRRGNPIGDLIPHAQNVNLTPT
jgi:hypothetical protein